MKTSTDRDLRRLAALQMKQINDRSNDLLYQRRDWDCDWNWNIAWWINQWTEPSFYVIEFTIDGFPRACNHFLYAERQTKS